MDEGLPYSIDEGHYPYSIALSPDVIFSGSTKTAGPEIVKAASQGMGCKNTNNKHLQQKANHIIGPRKKASKTAPLDDTGLAPVRRLACPCQVLSYTTDCHRPHLRNSKGGSQNLRRLKYTCPPVRVHNSRLGLTYPPSIESILAGSI